MPCVATLMAFAIYGLGISEIARTFECDYSALCCVFICYLHIFVHLKIFASAFRAFFLCLPFCIVAHIFSSLHVGGSPVNQCSPYFLTITLLAFSFASFSEIVSCNNIDISVNMRNSACLLWAICAKIGLVYMLLIGMVPSCSSILLILLPFLPTPRTGGGLWSLRPRFR